MTTKQQPPARPDGKPTLDQENHDKNVGQRERTTSTPPSEKGTIGPDKHGNAGERSSIIEDDSEVE